MVDSIFKNVLAVKSFLVDRLRDIKCIHLCLTKTITFSCSGDMSNVHESVFAKYERRNDVQLDFSEENPMEKYDFGDEIGRLVVYGL